MGLDEPKISTTSPPAMIKRASAVRHTLKSEIGDLAATMDRFQTSGGYASAGFAPMRRAG